MKQAVWHWLKQQLLTEEYVEAVYVREDKERTLRKLWRQRARLVMMLAGILILSLVLCVLQEPVTPLTEGRFLERENCGDTVSVKVKGVQKGETWEQEIALPIDSRDFTQKEREDLDKRTERYLRQTLPGQNKSLEQVETSLVFCTGVPDTDIDIRWTTEDACIQPSGELAAEEIPAEGLDTRVVAEASWKNWKKTYSFPLHIQAAEITPREQWSRQVKTVLQKELKEQSARERIELPEEIETVPVTYTMEQEKKSYTTVYVVLGCFLLLPVVWREQQRKKLREREQQLLLDHPGIVHKFMLLLGAGLTVRKVVERLVSEYERQREKGGKKRYVYEELCVLLQEMKDGVSEGRAMERFGRRCKLLPYLRFASVLTQNMKKGADGILAILETESMEALQQRKERALQLGEKAGTKLLFPMMLMLGIVMGMIMVPAFLTM